MPGDSETEGPWDTGTWGNWISPAEFLPVHEGERPCLPLSLSRFRSEPGMMELSMASSSSELKEDNGWRGKVFDSLSLPALILKPNRLVINVNKAFLNEFDTTKDEIIGQTCHEFFYQSEDPCPYDTCPLPKVLAEKTGQTILRRVNIPGRREKWEDRIFSPILDQGGEGPWETRRPTSSS